MSPPGKAPVGLAVGRAAKTLGRAFDDALAEAGGSQPVWLVLLALRTQPVRTQRELAHALDLREATVTHHLTAMERDGLVTRQRDPGNRRVQQVELTSAGDAMFRELRNAAYLFDRRLRDGIEPERLDDLLDTLGLLVANVTGVADASDVADTAK